MVKLQKIIQQLEEDVYESLSATLERNKADNFLYLLRAYRSGDPADKTVMDELRISTNSLYVLKSRLADRVQEHIAGDLPATRDEVLRRLNDVQSLCFSQPRELAESSLLKLEKDLLAHHMHSELLSVYSALKILNTFSEKFYHYSQMFNRHLAFALSIEKCEDLLGSFNRTLGQYHFSREQRTFDTLLFIHKEIADHLDLNPSSQVTLTLGIMELQLDIFCDRKLYKERDTMDVLLQMQKIINDLPEASQHKSWLPVVDYLAFEHFCKTGQWQSAQPYYDRTAQRIETLLLYTPVCLTSRFLISRINFLDQRGEKIPREEKLIYDEEDKYTSILLSLYRSSIAIADGKFKEAAKILNEVLNDGGLKDFVQISTEIRLSLAYAYLCQLEFDLADSLVKNITRKLKSEKELSYDNVLSLLRVFAAEIKSGTHDKPGQKQKDDFTLFMARNTGDRAVLRHILPQLKKKYL